MAPPATHRSTSGHENHDLGADRQARRHRCVQVIESLTDGLTAIPRAVAPSVRVVHGGRKGKGNHIVLTRPLLLGETASVAYVMRFAPAGVPATEYRRLASGDVGNLVVHRFVLTVRHAVVGSRWSWEEAGETP